MFLVKQSLKEFWCCDTRKLIGSASFSNEMKYVSVCSHNSVLFTLARRYNSCYSICVNRRLGVTRASCSYNILFSLQVWYSDYVKTPTGKCGRLLTFCNPKTEAPNFARTVLPIY
jgi:hypothetical protein